MSEFKQRRIHNFIEDLTNAIDVAPYGLNLSMEQCVELMRLMKSIKKDVRIADRLQSGELSEDVIGIAYDAAGKYHGFMSGHTACNMFQAMAKQMIKEVEGE